MHIRKKGGRVTHYQILFICTKHINLDINIHRYRKRVMQCQKGMFIKYDYCEEF